MNSRKLTGSITQRKVGTPSPVLEDVSPCATVRPPPAKLVSAEPGRIVLRLRLNWCRTPAEKVVDTPEQFRALIRQLRAAAREAWPQDDEGWRE